MKFKPKPNKPHLKISRCNRGFYLGVVVSIIEPHLTERALRYSSTLTPGFYKTPGEAARAIWDNSYAKI